MLSPEGWFTRAAGMSFFLTAGQAHLPTEHTAGHSLLFFVTVVRRWFEGLF